jgi:FMN phosphatase YigB (HAD superfamily)
MINLPDADLYIFDLDDTLINTREAYFSAQKTAIKEVLPELVNPSLADRLADLKWFCRIFGSGQPDNYFAAFVGSLPTSSAAHEKTVTSLVEAYHTAFQSNLRCLDGAKPFLQSLIDQKKMLALVSNGKTASQLNKLQVTGLEPFFAESTRFISETVSPTLKKPSPHLLKIACLAVDTEPAHAIFFGNSPEDILAGNLAGVLPVFIGEDPVFNQKIPDIVQPNFRLDHWGES